MPSKKAMVHALVPHGLDNFSQDRNPAIDELPLSYSDFEFICSLSSRYGFSVYADDDSFGGGQHIEMKRALMRALGQDVPQKAEKMPTRPEPKYVGRNPQFVMAPRAPQAAVPKAKLSKGQRKLVQSVISFIDEKCRLGFTVRLRLT